MRDARCGQINQGGCHLSLSLHTKKKKDVSVNFPTKHKHIVCRREHCHCIVDERRSTDLPSSIIMIFSQSFMAFIVAISSSSSSSSLSILCEAFEATPILQHRKNGAIGSGGSNSIHRHHHQFGGERISQQQEQQQARGIISFTVLPMQWHRKSNVEFDDNVNNRNGGLDAIASKIGHYAALSLTAMSLIFTTLPGQEANTMAWADTTTKATESTLVQTTSSSETTELSSSVIDEVWNLINKYYIDKTFNGQDWNKVRLKYVDLSKNADDAKMMKLVTKMVDSLGDRYTRTLDSQAYAAIQKYDLIGVGVTLMPDAQKEIIVGAPPIENSPSAKAGLKPGDFVTAVNGIPTKGRTAFDIIDQISEQPNAKTVSFSIRRQGSNDLVGEGLTFDVTMERQNLMQVKDPVEYKISESRKDGTTVGYLRVSEFNSLVNSKVQEALSELKKQGANAYVLDLRSNTGGAFQSAVEISGLFFEDRIATYVVDSNEVELPFRAPGGKVTIDPSSPLVVWIDGLSASASEVLAGSLHDNCRAVTMGDKSFGKGLIQAVYGLKNGAGLVLTVARYTTPGGNEIQGIGITPDIQGNMPAPVIIPVLSSDTSKVDFRDISKRLDTGYCQIPQEHATPSSSSQEDADTS